ncbi:MAG: electron transport complex subunit RsxC [Ruminococcaceae bacterium]|nr:electron transport complex subunit RsxC [Oscillospiraceae bacterium]
MFKRKNPGNTRIPHRKNTANLSPVRIAPPKEVLLPMDQHIGAPAVPVVKVGDTVKVGQLIADAAGPVSSPIYASVSGKVTKIEDCLRSNGRTVPAVRIESDGLMTVFEDLTPPTVTDIPSLVDALRKSGIVGMGGAGFPAAIKFDALKKGTIHTIVLNGAECEPYITSDARTMVDEPEHIYAGIKLIRSLAPSVKKCVIGIETNKPECIKALEEVTKGDDFVTVLPLPSLYPQGAEKVLVYNATGIVIPENKLPADMGTLVINVTTLATLAKYVETGMPLVERCLTVDGSAVKEPKNVIAPIGTSIADLVEFVGGLDEKPCKVIMGGPMTGRAARSLDEPIVKTSNAVVIMNEKDSMNKKMTACIHCGRCVEACPHLLNPAEFGHALSIDNVDERMARLEAARINLCMECGCCAFVCPAGRPFIENIRIAKNSLREYKAHKSSLK